MFTFFSDIKARLTALEAKVESLFHSAKQTVEAPAAVVATLEAAPAKVAEAVPAAVETVVSEVKADL